MIFYGRPFRDTLRAIGARARELRLLRKLRQADLAARAGVGVATVQRFEQRGAASLENVLRIASALGAEAWFDRLFEAPAYATLDEPVAHRAPSRRQRAPRG